MNGPVEAVQPTPTLRIDPTSTGDDPATTAAAQIPEPESLDCETPPLTAFDATTEPVPGAWFEDSFDTLDPAWQMLAGSWSIESGRLVQGDPGGYDLMTQLAASTPDDLRVEVTMQALDGPLGGGIMVSQPNPMTRAGSFLIDFSEGGTFVRWGSYDAVTGRYGYLGGAPTPDAFDPSAAHTMAVELREQGTRVLVDGVLLGEFGALPSGRVGLVTSLSATAFDDFSLTDLSDVDA